MHATPEQASAGQAIYSKAVLRLYDFYVLGLSNRLIWRCPTHRIEAHYDRHITSNHLDVGVGTGYFLNRARFPAQPPRVALMDLNPNSLDAASGRIARHNPEVYQRNVLEPIAVDAPKFDSVSINYLLHCLPGSIESKAIAFDHLKALMNPGAVLFGSTLLHGGVPRNAVAKRLMAAYNKAGIFSNQNDHLTGLKRTLSARFRDVDVRVVGCAALFSGRI